MNDARASLLLRIPVGTSSPFQDGSSIPDDLDFLGAYASALDYRVNQVLNS
jgi:hypothetical protein